MVKARLGKTPTQYAGLKPNLDDHFLGYWNKWNDEEKLTYVRYLERDSYKLAFAISTIIVVFFIMLILFLVFGHVVE